MADKQILVDAWTDSCANLSSAQDRFRNAINVFIVASFAITAFLVSEKSPLKCMSMQLAIIADIFLLLVFSTIVGLTYREIRMARITVELYQEALKKAFENINNVSSNDLFPDTKGKKPRMPLHNELLMAGVAIVIVVIKAALLFWLVR